MEKEIPVIIPAYEPDERLTELLQSLREAGFRNLVVVNDGSGEKYQAIFESAEKELHCTILTHAVNLGKGRALKTAFNYCLNAFPKMVGCVTADADGQHTAACILSCTEELVRKPDALILGSRNFDGEEVPARSEMGNKLTRAVMKYLAGISVSDTQTGLRGIPKEFMKVLLQVKGERYEFETNMLLEGKTKKITIAEVPIRTIYINDNQNSHFHAVRDSISVYMIFGRFLFSSFSSSIVDIVLFSCFCYLLKNKDLGNWGYIVVATAAARGLSALYNYFINQKVVFQSGKPIRETLWKYSLLAIVQMTCSALLVTLLYPLFGGAEVLVKIPVDVCLFLISFVIQREFVYR